MTTSAQQTPAAVQWSPSEALLKKLGPAVKVEGFSLQPPLDYKFIILRAKAPAGVTSYFWVGPGRKDGTHPVLMLSLIVPTGERPQNLTLNQLAVGLLAEIEEVRADWKQTDLAAGIVQGMPCVQVGWTGTDRKENRKMQGFIVVALDGNTVIELSSQDIVPYTEQALPIAEAATRTFKRPDPRIFYSVQSSSGHAQIYSMLPDGSDRICLTPNSDTDYRPVLSPDGTTIAFTTHRDGVRSIYLMNADGTNQRRVTEKEDAGLCTWSPDGAQLAFSSNRNGHSCIYVMNRDGSHVRRLTDGPSDDLPVWSPDGRQIAYEGMPDKLWRIYLVNVEGGPAKPLTRGTWNDRWPQWSPDGEAIVYSSYEHGKAQIYLMRPDGTSVTRLTTNSAEDREPTFTSDSRQVLFHSNRGGKFEIYSLDLATRQERRLAIETKDTTQVTTLGRSHSATP